MAALASSDVTYTIVHQVIADGGYRKNVVKIVFGDGALTYPTGGVPLVKGKMGVPTDIKSLKIFDADDSNGYHYKYDFANNKLRIYQAPAQTHAHDLKVIAGVTEDEGIGLETTGGPILGSTTGATFAKADSATKGGVLSETLAAAAMAELGGSAAPASATLYLEVVGF